MPKRFKFRLETVLKLRERDVDAQRRKVAERMRQLSSVEERRMHLQQQLTSAFEEARKRASGRVLDVPALAHGRYWISRLQRLTLESDIEIQNVEQQVAEERRVLAESMRKLRVLENLRDKALGEYQAELQRYEIAEADEQALRQFRQEAFLKDVEHEVA